MHPDIKVLSRLNGFNSRVITAFCNVQAPAEGFVKGRLVIKFEPYWFKRLAPADDFDKLINSGVEYKPAPEIYEPVVRSWNAQQLEYDAFDKAYEINPDAALLSTAIGAAGLMGFHYSLLSYESAQEMYDDFKTGYYAQMAALFRFILLDRKLRDALRKANWEDVAENWNGKHYLAYAEKTGTMPYSEKMRDAIHRLNFG